MMSRTRGPIRAALRFARRTGVLLWLVTGCAATVYGQSASQPAVTAAFLYNFAKFTSWPSEVSAARTIRFCVTDGPVADALQAAVAGHSIEGQALVVVRVTMESIPGNCAVVYAGGLSGRDTDRLLAMLAGSSVLSVGATSKFIEAGGVVRLYRDGEQMRFAINVDAARRARLILSSQLLALAKLTKDRTR